MQSSVHGHSFFIILTSCNCPLCRKCETSRKIKRSHSCSHKLFAVHVTSHAVWISTSPSTLYDAARVKPKAKLNLAKRQGLIEERLASQML
eukprot:3375149-Amphidinium_carterae.1